MTSTLPSRPASFGQHGIGGISFDNGNKFIVTSTRTTP
jgi:hypothetical protein